MPRARAIQPEPVLNGLEPVSNDAATIISFQEPYSAMIRVKGTAPLLFHRWSCESVEEKANASKGSKAKKTDDVNSYVYRGEKGEICIPSEYFRQSIIHAAKYKQDPRSPRKSAMDLFKAAIFSPEPLCSLGMKDWHYIDRRRVTVQRNGITRSRPAINTGWECTFFLECLLPEYVSPLLLNQTIQSAGRLIGIADNRPTYGRFQIIDFKVR